MKFTDAEKSNIVNLYTVEKVSLKKLAASYSTHSQAIKKVLREFNIPIDSNPQAKSLTVDIEILKNDYEAGLSLEDLTKKYNQPKEEVRRKLKEIGVVMRSNKLEVPPKEELYNLYVNENKNFLDISKEYNVSNVTIKKWMVQYNIPLRGHSENIKQTVVPKVKATCLEKYGVESLFSNKEFTTKCMENRLEKYGTLKYTNKGKAEQEVIDYLNSFGHNFKPNVTILEGRELDGYDENLKLAVEYCGLHWHNEITRPDPAYHYKKFKDCEAKGIRLITIWETEWKDKKSQVKSFLRSLVDSNMKTIYARNCTVSKIPLHEAAKFVNTYHIQGYPGSTIKEAYGIFHDDIMYGCVTMGRHHRNNTEHVLSRMCFADGFKIVGGASKLVSHILNDYPTIVSWSDNRWSQGNVYEKIGFTKDKEYRQDYFYVERTNVSNIHSKQSKQKKYINCKPGQTEHERCLELGLVRVYDCGKIRWVISKE